MSFDVLQEKIIRMKNPTVVGLDPKPEYVPEHIRKASYEQFGETLEGAADAVFQFNKGLIDALCDVVPAVKPQSAYYERLGWHGMAALEKTIRYAHEKGMYVIADIKRGDIGSTAEAYADAWLGVTKVGEALCGGFNRRLRHPQRLHGRGQRQPLPKGGGGTGQERVYPGQDLQPRLRRAPERSRRGGRHRLRPYGRPH